jgi:hypothetical protein
MVRLLDIPIPPSQNYPQAYAMNAKEFMCLRKKQGRRWGVKTVPHPPLLRPETRNPPA